jgi:hypothetical protein
MYLALKKRGYRAYNLVEKTPICYDDTVQGDLLFAWS